MKCKGNKIGRRSFMHVGMLGGVGLGLSDYFRIKASSSRSESSMKVLKGQLSLSSISTCREALLIKKPLIPSLLSPSGISRPNVQYTRRMVPDVRLNEMMKNTAKVMDKISIIRSMTHGEAAHERGTHNMFTGYRPSPALQYPSIGSVVAHEFGPRHNLPPYVCIPNQPNEFAGTGYLSSSFSGFSLGSDPC